MMVSRQAAVLNPRTRVFVYNHDRHIARILVVDMSSPPERAAPHVNQLPVETLATILSYLPNPNPPLHEHDMIRRRREWKSSLATQVESRYDPYGWFPAAWVCHLWRSVILSERHLHVPVFAHDERALPVLESTSPLPIELYVSEDEWASNESIALQVQSIFRSCGQRVRSLHVWTKHRRPKRSQDESSTPQTTPLLPNVIREMNLPLLEEFHALGRYRHLRGGCIEPGYRDQYPRSISFPDPLSKNLRVLDLSGCTIASAGSLATSAPAYVKLVGCPGIWDCHDVRPDQGVVADRDDINVPQYRLPFTFTALRHLHLEEDSMPSAQALAALGSITLPALEQLRLCGPLSQALDTLNGFRYPPTASVSLSCVWDDWTYSAEQDVLDIEPSSLPVFKGLAAKYLAEDTSLPRASTMVVDIQDTEVDFKCISESGHAFLSFHIYALTQWARDIEFTGFEEFLGNAFSVFSGVRQLVVSSHFEHETYRRYGVAEPARRCRWYAAARQRLADVTDLELSWQAARHLLEFCEEKRGEGVQCHAFPALEEMVLKAMGIGRPSRVARSDDTETISRLLEAELAARPTPFQIRWDTAGAAINTPSH
ncbi:unnamed protein product [Peniophora sp. CBMAI 1063]|nr:unnamed protein product [Peniophora sp. CBMAI 1063]